MMITLLEFKKLFPNAKQKDETYKGLVNAMFKYDIIGKARETMFLAQLAHESAGFLYDHELGSRAYFQRYEGRKDLGNTTTGDGYKFRGRGYIQLTGRANYKTYGQKLGLDLLLKPDLASDRSVAPLIASQYWVDKGLNALADLGKFKEITKKINGGYNGYNDRVAWLKKIEKYYP